MWLTLGPSARHYWWYITTWLSHVHQCQLTCSLAWRILPELLMFWRFSIRFLWSTIRLVLFLIYLGRVDLFVDCRFWSFSCKLWVSCDFHWLLVCATKRRLFCLGLVLSTFLRVIELLLCVMLSDFCTTLMDKLMTTMLKGICMKCSTIRHQWWSCFIRRPSICNLRCILGLLLAS